MTMPSLIAQLVRDEDGGPLVEVAIIFPILILFLFGGVDFMNALYQWNAAAKAVQIGARIAAVSDPVASGLNSISDDVLSPDLVSGSPMPDFIIDCSGGSLCA
jgi:Flp pilus assembly protein TadG